MAAMSEDLILDNGDNVFRSRVQAVINDEKASILNKLSLKVLTHPCSLGSIFLFVKSVLLY